MESLCQTLQSCLSSSSCSLDSPCECISALEDISFAIPKDVSLQKKILSEEELFNPILEYGRRIYESRCEDFRLTSLKDEMIKTEKVDQANAWVMCSANLIAGNPDARHMLWVRLGAFRVCQVLIMSPPLIAQKWCVVMQNLLLEKDILNSFIENEELDIIIHRLCDLYSFETATNRFPLYCLELLLFSGRGSVAECWKALSVEDRIMCLGIINPLLKGEEKRPFEITQSSITLISSIFKFELEKVLDAKSNDSNKFTSLAIRESCSCLVSVAINDEYREWLQKDESLLLCVLDFLKVMNAATYTESGGNSSIVWCRKNICSTDDGKCMRSDLVHILANLVFDCPSNHEKLRNAQGLEEIFSSCKRDENNPLMHQAVMLALSYCLKQSEENREYLRNFLTSTEHDALLERLHMKPNQYAQMR